MKQYIDKSALVAEIDRQKIGYNVDGKHSVEYDTTRKILNIINTLEVKEIQEEPTSNGLKTESYLENKYKEILKQLKANGGKLWKG